MKETISLIIGLIVGGLGTKFMIIPIIEIFFKLGFLTQFLIYLFMIFMSIGLSSMILKANTALNKIIKK